MKGFEWKGMSLAAWLAAVAVTGCDIGGPTPPPAGAPLRVLAANDLGMHCADLDYQIFSILPPFNVVHAQVIRTSVGNSTPKLLDDTQVDVFYSSTSNPLDPVGPNSSNTSGAGKTNFWQAEGGGTLGGATYRSLYPGQDKLGLCDATLGPCPSALDLFEPIPLDTGLPVPDPAQLPVLSTGQQSMPGIDNHPRPFDRFDRDLPFFAGFPFGAVVSNASWWAADGVPLIPVDDLGRSNAYPLMKVAAVTKGADPSVAANVQAAVDVVLPVASEADCQNCHADPSDFGNGRATSFAATDTYRDGATPWVVAREADAPGPQQLLNAAKINILRLHDAKHGDRYTSSVDASPTRCMDGTEASCLANRTPVQCSQCHYSPALDLAQVGPVDEPEQGEAGRQQARHISMSRAMHGYHGQYTDLFPTMPSPEGRTLAQTQDILGKTCYQCHPGKQTKCLRGAMSAAGVVCQDCHGNMEQVGNDFTVDFPTTAGAVDLSRRVPWAREPKCQSCHIGDAMTVDGLLTADHLVAADGIRLRQAYLKSDANAANLPMIASPGSRFAENEGLYRLSKGHGGVMCEGCHGSPHAIWPVQPDEHDGRGFLANDNLAAIQGQGHSGTLIECAACHEDGSLGLTLGGPHGMHPVNDSRWTRSHEDFAERNKNACRACHGRNGEGTVLARVAADRTLHGDDGRVVHLSRGDEVTCSLCHRSPL